MRQLLLSLFLLTFCICSHAQLIHLQTRWYSHYHVLDYLHLDSALNKNEYYVAIWQDSTVQEKRDSVYKPIRYSSYYQVIDPVDSKIFDDSNFWHPIITQYDSYEIDSVAIWGTYVRMPNQPKNQVDTLICSIVPVSGGKTPSKIFINKTQQPNISWYTNKDSLFAYRPYLIDSNNLAAYADTNAISPKRALFKIPLTAQDGDSIKNGKYPAQKVFVAGPTKPLAIGAGDIFAVTVSFKSGGTWAKNTPIDSLHRFMTAVSYVKPDTAMPYYFDSHQDRNTSGFMLANSYTYTPSIVLETNSTPSYKEEFISIAAVVSCYCTNSISEVYNNSKLSVYPNPAKEIVHFKYKGKTTSQKLSITIVNSVGITVAEIPLSTNNNTSWQTNNIPTGVYFYQLRDVGKIIATGKIILIK